MKKQKLALVCLAFLALLSCKSDTEKSQEKTNLTSTPEIQVQGHRGDRGNFPENSIPAFISAVKKGVDVIELDIVISKDSKVVVSHEPYMSSLFVNTPAGDSIKKEEERSYNIYRMTYDSIKLFDAGSKGNRRFPDQRKMKTHKPLLSEVIDSVESYIASEEMQPIKYNIELKSAPEGYGIYQPEPAEFIDLVMDVLKQYNIQMNIQSFDTNILTAMNSKYPEVILAYLVSEEGIEKNLTRLGFNPEIYSPHYSLVKSTKFVDSIKNLKMDLIPWTVNEKEDIKKMLELKVDGIITDYPERVIELKKTLE